MINVQVRVYDYKGNNGGSCYFLYQVKDEELRSFVSNVLSFAYGHIPALPKEYIVDKLPSGEEADYVYIQVNFTLAYLDVAYGGKSCYTIKLELSQNPHYMDDICIAIYENLGKFSRYDDPLNIVATWRKELEEIMSKKTGHPVSIFLDDYNGSVMIVSHKLA